MKTILEKFMENHPDTLKDDNGLPQGICPDDLNNKYISVCDEGFDITKELCKHCWDQPIKQGDNVKVSCILMSKAGVELEAVEVRLMEDAEFIAELEKFNKWVVMAVPGPPIIIEVKENIEKFLALRGDPVLNAAARERVKKFNRICTVIKRDKG